MQIRQKPVTRKNRGIHSAIHFDEDCREKFPRVLFSIFCFQLQFQGQCQLMTEWRGQVVVSVPHKVNSRQVFMGKFCHMIKSSSNLEVSVLVYRVTPRVRVCYPAFVIIPLDCLDVVAFCLDVQCWSLQVPLGQELANFIVSGQRVNILGFAGHVQADSLFSLLSVTVWLCWVRVLFSTTLCSCVTRWK